MMVLAVVGTRVMPHPAIAGGLVEAAINGWTPHLVISGGADGIDSLAEAIATDLGYDFEAIKPAYHQWAGPGGYQHRNRRMAEMCDVLVAIRSRSSNTFGSGWTADEAERIGKTVYRWEMP